MFCMQEEKRANKRDKRGAEECTGAVEAVAVSRLTDGDWLLRWRCCGGRPVAMSWLTDDDSQATVLLFQVEEKKKASALPFSSFSSSSSATFPFPFVPFRYGFSKPERFRCQCRFFLNSHGPLSFTSHCPSRYVFPVFFPLFFGLFSPLLSSVPSLFFSIFSFPPPFPPFRVLALGGIYRAKGSGGVPIATLWQRIGSRAGCPATAPGWLGCGRGWQGATPLVYHHESVWGFGKWQACGV